MDRNLHVLNHDGRPSARPCPLWMEMVMLDGAQTQAMYYELVYGDAAATAN